MEIKIMKARTIRSSIGILLKTTHILVFAVLFALFVIQGISFASDEFPLDLPKVEGSKSFDMEIDQLNIKGIDLLESGEFVKAEKQFRKGMNLAQQLRDPSLGILNYNLALSLHKSGRHEAATPFFAQARKYARGNKTILGSPLLRKHECGFNPSVDCRETPSKNMTIEGSN